MIQTVLKRDGRIVGFNEEKIIAAWNAEMYEKYDCCGATGHVAYGQR